MNVEYITSEIHEFKNDHYCIITRNDIDMEFYDEEVNKFTQIKNDLLKIKDECNILVEVTEEHDFDSDSNYSIYKIKVYDVRSPDIPRIKSIVCDKSYIVSKTSDVLNSLFI